MLHSIVGKSVQAVATNPAKKSSPSKKFFVVAAFLFLFFILLNVGELLFSVPLAFCVFGGCDNSPLVQSLFAILLFKLVTLIASVGCFVLGVYSLPRQYKLTSVALGILLYGSAAAITFKPANDRMLYEREIATGHDRGIEQNAKRGLIGTLSFKKACRDLDLSPALCPSANGSSSQYFALIHGTLLDSQPSQGKEFWTSPYFYTYAHSDQFIVSGIAPGKYRIYAGLYDRHQPDPSCPKYLMEPTNICYQYREVMRSKEIEITIENDTRLIDVSFAIDQKTTTETFNKEGGY